MFSHTTLGVADVDLARRFYDPLLGALGLELKFANDTWAGWKSTSADKPLFLITRPYDGHSASAGNGQMIAFLGRVDKFEPVSRGGEMNHAEEAVGELVVAGGGGAVDFEVAEHALDAVALLVERTVMLNFHATV